MHRGIQVLDKTGFFIVDLARCRLLRALICSSILCRMIGLTSKIILHDRVPKHFRKFI